MSDLFHEKVSFSYIERMFDVIQPAPYILARKVLPNAIAHVLYRSAAVEKRRLDKTREVLCIGLPQLARLVQIVFPPGRVLKIAGLGS